MSSNMSVQPGELRASAHTQSSIADDLKKPCDKAIADTGAAGDSANGWPVASALHMISETWQPALDGLHKRLLQGAGNLRDTADNHEWNDDMVDQDFEDFDGDKAGVIMSAPASGGGPGSPVYAGLPRPNAPGPDPIWEAVGEYQPAPGTPSRNTDDMLHAKPAMPVYDPGEALSGRGRGAALLHADDNPFG
ncbi:type VII secretion target [Streptomyces sp. NPDC048506]|uniref:type VII secretion target n=1 Tax=Streptomyces sp. NPDC048506 TaxID=3155028 RepID=UPI0034172C2E